MDKLTLNEFFPVAENSATGKNNLLVFDAGGGGLQGGGDLTHHEGGGGGEGPPPEKPYAAQHCLLNQLASQNRQSKSLRKRALPIHIQNLKSTINL